jgi:tetratricopeptide (TPR) repeat protein
MRAWSLSRAARLEHRVWRSCLDRTNATNATGATARWSTRGVLPLAVACAVGLLVAGCAASEATQVKKQAEIVRQEQAWDRLFARGKAFAMVGDLTRAEQYLVAALDNGGNPSVVLPVLMSVLVEGKRYRLAIDLVENHLKTHPDAYRLRFVLGTLYMAVGDTTLARARLEEVAAHLPPEPEAHYALGVLFRDTEKDLLRADKHFRAYLAMKPDGAHVQDARASLLKSVP